MNAQEPNSPAPRPRGGPQTPHGKAASRRNAVKHGLSAKTLLPDALTIDLFPSQCEQLRAEWQPTTPTQEFFVLEMARHAAVLERAQQIEEAVLRHSARGAVELLDPETEELRDVMLAGAGTSDAIERLTRYRRSHERAFFQALSALRMAKDLTCDADERAPGQSNRTEQHSTFETEADCEAYLQARWASRQLGCPSCSSRGGRWIASRKVWKCRGCDQELSLRSGTVMVGSRLCLLSWFRAIELLLRNPTASTADVMKAAGIHRAGTARQVAQRIRHAAESEQAAPRLAGLDRVFGTSSLQSRRGGMRS